MTDQRPDSLPKDPLPPSGYRIAVFVIALIVALLFGAFFLYRTLHVLELFTIAFIIAMAINPLVSFLERHGVRRFLSVAMLIILLLGLVALGLWSLVPKVIDQASQFAHNSPQVTAGLRGRAMKLQDRFPALKNYNVVDKVEKQLQEKGTAIGGQVATISLASAGAIFETVLVLFITVFFLIDPKPLVKGIRGVLPDRWQPEADRIGALAVGKVEAWIQGSLILMATIAVCDTVGLLLLGVPYALLFGVLSGLLEIIPTVGPIIAAIPPTLVALSIEPSLALKVLILYTVVQQMESNILVPLIMSNKVRLHPVTLLFFLLVMAEFLGVFGALIATPLAAVIKVLYLELYYRPLHGDLPEEEKEDPIRQNWLRRFAKRVPIGKPPGPPALGN